MNNSIDSFISSNWSESTGSHTKSDLLQIQDLKMQNIHLNKLVKQLQNSLDSANNQLKQALVSSNQKGNLHEENIRLRRELKTIKDHFNDQLEEMKNKLAEEQEISYNEKSKLTKHISRLEHKYSQQTRLCDSLREENVAKKACIDDANQKIECMAKEISKIGKSKSKHKKEVRQLYEEQDSLLDKYTCLIKEKDLLIKENEQLQIHYDNIQTEFETLKKKNSELSVLADKRGLEILNLNHALELIEAHVQTLKNDCSVIADERSKLIKILQRVNNVASIAEDAIEALNTKNEKLRAKISKLSGSSFPNENLNLDTFTFPFDEDVKIRIKDIMRLDQFQSSHKMQMILNELAKTISGLSSQKSELTREHIEQAEILNKLKSDYKTIYNMLHSVLREWKNLECFERKMDTIAFCHADENFLTFVANKCVKLDNLSEVANFLGPLFVPTTIFDDEHYEERKELINEIAKTNRDVSNIITAMFLVNTRLKKQVDQLTESAASKSKTDSLLRDIGVEDYHLIPEYISDLQEKILHLKQTRKEVHMALVSAKESLEQKVEEEFALSNEIQTLKIRLNELQSENAELKEKVRNVRCENATLTYGCIDTSTDEFKSTIEDLKRQLKEKTRENHSLEEKVSQLIFEQASNEKAHTQILHDTEQNLTNQINELTNALKYAEQKLTKNRKKMKSAVVDMRKKCEESIESVIANYENNKQEISVQLVEAKSIADRAEAELSSIQRDYSSSRQQIDSLTDENIKLKNNIKGLEMKINSIQEQNIRTLKAQEATNVAHILGLESQYQKEQKEMRLKLEKEKQKLIDMITQKIASVYGIESIDNDEAALSQMFDRIQADIVKLRFFQEQATKL